MKQRDTSLVKTMPTLEGVLHAVTLIAQSGRYGDLGLWSVNGNWLVAKINRGCAGWTLLGMGLLWESVVENTVAGKNTEHPLRDLANDLLDQARKTVWGHSAGPLRKVLGRVGLPAGTGSGIVRATSGSVPYEVYECGHVDHPKHDMIGETATNSRRCRHCRDDKLPCDHPEVLKIMKRHRAESRVSNAHEAT